ncbi:MAG: hypothetical protein Q9227_004853 [Pyrenula ochraceoflavens]
MGSIDTSTPESIPTVDISSWLSPSATEKDRQNVVDAMSAACHTYGFFHLAGHGVSEKDRDIALNCSKRFFELTPEERMEVWIGKCKGRSLRGYEPPGIQTHQNGLKPDTKEVSHSLTKSTAPILYMFCKVKSNRLTLLEKKKALIIGAEIPEDDPEAGTFSTGPNLWPKQIPDSELRTPIMEYQAKMVELVKILLKILARGLPKEWNQPADCLDPLAENRPSIPMRLLHYAPQSVEDAQQFGGNVFYNFPNKTPSPNVLRLRGIK